MAMSTISHLQKSTQSEELRTGTAVHCIYDKPNEVFGWIVDPRTLTKEQLLDAIENYYGTRVVICPDGQHNMFDENCGAFEFR
jgi:hypothetical protein